MTVSFDKILTSRTFQFLVGPDSPDRKPFTIHTTVVEDLSGPLAALMNGAMREAADGVATLEDIDQQTFIRFCEYAYMGDYTPAQRQLVSPAFKTGRPDSPATDTLDEYFQSSRKKKKGKGAVKLDDWATAEETCCGTCSREVRVYDQIWDDFQRRDYTVISPKFRPREDPEECEDSTNHFLGHARVYVFADRYDIVGLRILALDKLHQALCTVKVAEIRMVKIIDLIHFSYSNDNTRDNDSMDDIECLRSMVVQFVVCWYKTIVKENGFLELIAEGGCFARDLVGLLSRRIDGSR